MLALVVLVAAFGLCAALLWAAAPVTEAVIGLLPASSQQNPAVADTLFTLIFFGALIAIAMIGGALSGFNSARLGRRPVRNALLGAALGTIGVAAVAGYAWAAGTLRPAPGSADLGLLAWGSAVVLLQTSAEEIYFRGWLQRVMSEQWGTAAAVPVAALAFAALHFLGGARDPVSVANLFLGGLVFGLLAARRRGLAAAIAAHFSWNWCEDILLGLSPNPGLGSFGAFVNLDLAGAALWGGSEEGLNASLAMTLTLLALLVPLALLGRGAAIAESPGPGRSAPARP